MTLQESKHMMISPLKKNLWLNIILLAVGAGILVTHSKGRAVQ